ncbi:hypothetical protein V1291_003888 [Nitrobacteraceae bacterium AZCC 1564]
MNSSCRILKGVILPASEAAMLARSSASVLLRGTIGAPMRDPISYFRVWNGKHAGFLEPAKCCQSVFA